MIYLFVKKQCSHIYKGLGRHRVGENSLGSINSSLSDRSECCVSVGWTLLFGINLIIEFVKLTECNYNYQYIIMKVNDVDSKKQSKVYIT